MGRILQASGIVLIKSLVSAFFHSYFDKLIQEQNEGWRNYGALIGRIVWDPLALPVFNEDYNEVSKHYLVALTKAAPEIEEEHIHRAFQFLLATMYSAGADNRRIDNLSGGKFSSQDFDRIYESVIPFVTGGFKALAKASIVSHVRGDAA